MSRLCLSGLVLALALLAPRSASAADTAPQWGASVSPAWTSEHAVGCEESGGVWVDGDGDGVFDDGECRYEDQRLTDDLPDGGAWAPEDASASAIEFGSALAKTLKVPLYMVVLDRKGTVRGKIAFDGSDATLPPIDIGVLVLVGKTRFTATKVGAALLDAAASPRFVRSSTKANAQIDPGVLVRLRHRLLAVTNATDVAITVEGGKLTFKPGPSPCG
jgi:hypothetical protein